MAKLFIVCGSPGSGKSTYARELARLHRAFLLDIDTGTERIIKKALLESGHDPNDRDSTYFKEKYRLTIYETLFDLARENLEWSNVIIAGPFTREIRDPEWPSRLSDNLKSPVEIHYTYCDPETRKERLLKRSNPRDLQKLEDWDNHVKYYGDEEPPFFAHVFIDTSRSGNN